MGRASITLIQGCQPLREFHLGEGEHIIGRDNCEICIEDGLASRRHALVKIHGDQYLIEDLGSTNGTLLNGIRVECPVPLRNGDRIVIGDSALAFHGDSSEATIGYQTMLVRPSCEEADMALDALAGDPLSANWDVTDTGEIRRAAEALSAVNRLAMKIASITETRRLHEQAVYFILAEMPDVWGCSIQTADEADGGKLACRAGKTRDGALAAAPPTSSTLSEIVVKDGRSLLVSDVANEARLASSKSVVMMGGVESAMCVPLLGRECLLGVIQAWSRQGAEPFGERHLRMLTAIGAIVGGAIQNAKLWEALETEKSRLEAANRELERARETVIRNERLAAVGKLAAGIVHDIKNPMVVIQGHAQLLAELVSAADIGELDGISVSDGLSEIIAGVKQCSGIINQLLQFARQTKPSRTPTDLAKLAAETAEFLRHEFNKAGVELKLRLQEGAPSVSVDQGQIKQSLINILLNAIQAIDHDGGVVELAVTARDAGRGCRAETLITITDNGAGMPDEVMEKIFEPFFTTKEASDDKTGGSGLGLAACHGIIANHGGAIEVASKPGKGTTFTISIPCQEPAEGA